MLMAARTGRRRNGIAGVSSFLMCLVTLPGCGLADGDREANGHGQANAMTQSGMAAGPGEMTLAEKYKLNIHLPMREDEFLQILEQLGLYYQICGRRGSSVGLPVARHETSIDLSNAQTCYEIDGDRNLSGGRAEAWRAFADRQGRIFYVEAAYSYPAP